MAIEAFSDFIITISDGGTVPSLDYLSKKTYVDIGSGNVLKVSWGTPVATNNAVDSYKITLLYYNNATAAYKTLYSANIGNVNEFYLRSNLLSTISQSFSLLRIYVDVISKHGSTYNGTSNTVAVNVSRGSGSYLPVMSKNNEQILKRTVALTKLDYTAVTDSSGELVADSNGKTIYTKRSSVQDETSGWTLMQEFYKKDADGTFRASDIAYEVLTDQTGEIVTDSSGASIYLL
jgi:hypothetical protein